MDQPLSNNDVTRLLNALGEGDRTSSEELLAVLHDELRALARRRMAQERPDHTLQPTALVNEAYMRLVQGDPSWQGRAHFFGAAAEAMRRILIDHARARMAKKRGGDLARMTFHDLDVQSEDPDLDLLALDEALTALEAFDARLADVVRLRYFAGLGIDETSQLLEVSPATVKRDWTYARAWLLERMGAAD
ncbi:MAG: ECF-type sigma factor [Planctomycetota bacterium]